MEDSISFLTVSMQCVLWTVTCSVLWAVVMALTIQQVTLQRIGNGPHHGPARGMWRLMVWTGTPTLHPMLGFCKPLDPEFPRALA